jgi:hypothetical protein
MRKERFIDRFKNANNAAAVVVLFSVLSGALLHGLYHPHLLAEAAHKVGSAIGWFVPGSDLFHVTHSPLLIFVLSMVFWFHASKKNAWTKFKRQAKWFVKNVLAYASFTTFVTGVLVLVFALLYHDLKKDPSLSNVWDSVLSFQLTVYVWFLCIRKHTLPWLRFQYKQHISVMRAKADLLSGKDFDESRIAFIVAVKQKEERSWLRQKSH